jgi:EAL domain-containing protein (putative c-di-GMP-specific phosphodiesterase class I)
MGVSLALDDFGTGYSSLRYIDKLPFDTLKIDKAFIQSIDSRYEGGEIATAIVSLARSFGMESIAEGVETPEQLDALRSRGCDTIQGFFVSKPLSVDGFWSFVGQTSETRELEPQV